MVPLKATDTGDCERTYNEGMGSFIVKQVHTISHKVPVSTCENNTVASSP